MCIRCRQAGLGREPRGRGRPGRPRAAATVSGTHQLYRVGRTVATVPGNSDAARRRARPGGCSGGGGRGRRVPIRTRSTTAAGRAGQRRTAISSSSTRRPRFEIRPLRRSRPFLDLETARGLPAARREATRRGPRTLAARQRPRRGLGPIRKRRHCHPASSRTHNRDGLGGWTVRQPPRYSAAAIAPARTGGRRPRRAVGKRSGDDPCRRAESGGGAARPYEPGTCRPCRPSTQGGPRRPDQLAITGSTPVASTRIRGAGRRTRGPRIRPGGAAPPPGGPTVPSCSSCLEDGSLSWPARDHLEPSMSGRMILLLYRPTPGPQIVRRLDGPLLG